MIYLPVIMVNYTYCFDGIRHRVFNNVIHVSDIYIFCLKMANAIVKKVKGQGKRSVVRPRVASLVGTLKSIAEFEKRAIGVTITYPTTTSNRCNNESSSSSKRVTGVTVMDNILTILVYIQKEQRNQRREDVRTLRTCR